MQPLSCMSSIICIGVTVPQSKAANYFHGCASCISSSVASQACCVDIGYSLNSNTSGGATERPDRQESLSCLDQLWRWITSVIGS
jgi:hypothetical protein